MKAGQDVRDLWSAPCLKIGQPGIAALSLGG